MFVPVSVGLKSTQGVLNHASSGNVSENMQPDDKIGEGDK